MRALVRLALAAAATVILATSLVGCAALPLIAALPGPGEWTSPTGSATQAQAYSDGSTSVRGNIPKTVGEEAGMLDAGVRTVTFMVTRIIVDPTCMNPGATKPAFGHYVEVDLHVVTTSALGYDGSGDTVTFHRENWYSYSQGDDQDEYEAWDPSDQCEAAMPPLPDRISRSQNVTGSVMLDVQDGTSYLAYESECGCHGWEWPYPPVIPAKP